MGIDLDMTRSYRFNRDHIERMHTKRQVMRRLYMKGLEANNYSYYSDNIPAEVVAEVKRQIKSKYRVIRIQLWLKTFSGFILLAGIILFFAFLLFALYQ